jgi:hypothetical protein
MLLSSSRVFLSGLLTGSTTNANQENKDWAHFTDSAGSKADTSSVSSEAESMDDVWTITDEQRDYYINQFRTMQTDVRGVISGRNLSCISFFPFECNLSTEKCSRYFRCNSQGIF